MKSVPNLMWPFNYKGQGYFLFHVTHPEILTKTIIKMGKPTMSNLFPKIWQNLQQKMTVAVSKLGLFLILATAII